MCCWTVGEDSTNSQINSSSLELKTENQSYYSNIHALYSDEERIRLIKVVIWPSWPIHKGEP